MTSAPTSHSRHVVDPLDAAPAGEQLDAPAGGRPPGPVAGTRAVLAVMEGDDVVAVATATLELRPAMTYSSARLSAGEVAVRTDRPVRLTVERSLLPTQRTNLDAPAELGGSQTIEVRLEWGHFVIACDGKPALERIAPARLRVVRMPGWPVAVTEDAPGR